MEAHCHIGLDGYGSGNAGADYNETNDPVTPQLRAIDGINAMDPCLNMAAKAGITCFATGPGSTNALGGTFTAIKPNGKRVDNMIVKEAIAMKCAFGENPKRRYGDKKIATRMTNVALIREAFRKAIQYKAKVDAADGDITKMPVYDAKCEALIPVLDDKGDEFELAAIERKHILKVLQHTHGNKTETARLLKIGLATLYRKIDSYGIQ